jgi:hypothetical protein
MANTTPPNEGTILSPEAQALLYQLQQLKPAEVGELLSKKRSRIGRPPWKSTKSRKSSCESATKP